MTEPTRRDRYYVATHMSMYMGAGLLNWPAPKDAGLRAVWTAEKERHDRIIVECGPLTWTPLFDIAAAQAGGVVFAALCVEYESKDAARALIDTDPWALLQEAREIQQDDEDISEHCREQED